jgi:hypothetical protein
MKRFLLACASLFAFVLFPIDATAASRVQKIAAAPPKPSIEVVRGRTVRVRVPAGLQSVTLERCTSARLARWENIATKPAARAGGIVEFQLPAAVSRRFLRVKGSVVSSAPLVGASVFLADPAWSGTLKISDNLTFDLASDRLNLAGTVTSSVVSSSVRTVSESDIWRVVGDRLYFFNEIRGLQVFDITDPDDPALLGQLRAPGNGEQMYLLDNSHVALLTRTPSYLRLGSLPVLTLANSNGAYSGDIGSVVLVDVATGKPKELARMNYAGSLRESRLVGSVLYVVSEAYGDAESGLRVTSFDLSDPATPVVRATLVLGAWGGVVTATERFLFVVNSSGDWRHSLIDVIDISSPTGALVRRGRIEVAGLVNDKFKMHLDGETFTVVSAIPQRWNNLWSAIAPSSTMVETFSLANPDAPVKLGALELGVGETVRATRFDEQRLYVVTFFQIDPLWVVDLSRPATPTLLGELEVPGFSNYIEPLGDRLVAVGRVGNRTAVSLFDVSDPAHPVALSQILLGDGYSTSEANWDEKAFNVMPEENLIVVPYSGYDAASAYADRVQLIDLTRDALVKRGVIEHGLAARRTAVKGNRLLAISASDLVTVDFADRDRPRVTSEVEIAWRVDRVLLAGDYLVQIGGSANWRNGAPQTVSISTSANPDTVFTTVALDAQMSVVGASVRDGRLYVAQYRGPYDVPTYIVWRPDGSANATTDILHRPAAFVLSVFDLTDLPRLPRLAQTTSEIDLGYLQEMTAVWPSPGVLVWVEQLSSARLWGGGVVYPIRISPPQLVTLNSGGLIVGTTSGLTRNDVVVDSAPPPPAATSPSAAASVRLSASSSGTLTLANSAITANIVGPYWNAYRSDVKAVVFNVSVPTAPVLASHLNIGTGSNGDWSEPFAADGKLYLSSMVYEDFMTIGTQNGTATSTPSRRYRHFLKVVALADPAHPIIGSEVNIPGRLIGVSNGGARLYTFGCRYEVDGAPLVSRALHVSTFDGTAASFVDQLPLADYGDSYALDGDTVLLGVRGVVASPSRIQAWQLDGAGRFQLLSETATGDASSLYVIRGLLVGGGSGSRQLYDVTDAANVRDLGAFPQITQYWYGSDLRKADGSPSRGLWEPLGNYGVNFVEFAD